MRRNRGRERIGAVSNSHKRKAKAALPALAGSLSPVLRDAETKNPLRCPPALPSAARHHPYQERKDHQEKESALGGPDVREDER